LGVLLALASSVCYGIADFAGGLLSRRAGFIGVALVGQIGGFLAVVMVAPMVSSPVVQADDIAWGVLSGVGTGIGMLFLYRGLSRGSMSVVVPVAAVGGLAIPVVLSVALLGDRPSTLAWFGILTAIPSLWLVTGGADAGRLAETPASVDGLFASAGIAVQYFALAQVDAESGLWPVAAGRLAAIVAILPLALPAGSRPTMTRWSVLGAAATGAMAAAALVSYLLATREQLVTVAVVLSSLYPVIPVVLGITALRERLNWQQSTGLVVAGVAVSLLSVT
jgi:drug/metabolite transporter (DMT)-like permease